MQVSSTMGRQATSRPRLRPTAAGWHAVMVRALAWLLLICLGQTVAADGPGGRPCTLSLAATSAPKSARPGQKLKLRVKWTNAGGAGFADGVLQLQLPPHTTFKGALAASKSRVKGQKPAYDSSTRTVTWSRFDIPAKSTVTLKVAVKVRKCYDALLPELTFVASAYVMDPNAGEPTPLCTQEDPLIVVSESI
jgi:hypothetical protein